MVRLFQQGIVYERLVGVCNDDKLFKLFMLWSPEHGTCLSREPAPVQLHRDSVDALAELARFSQLLQETEHFWRWHQEQVAKIVPYAPPFINELAVLREATVCRVCQRSVADRESLDPRLRRVCRLF